MLTCLEKASKQLAGRLQYCLLPGTRVFIGVSSFVIPTVCLMKKRCHKRLPGGYAKSTLAVWVVLFFSQSGILRGRAELPNAHGAFAIRVVSRSAFGEPQHKQALRGRCIPAVRCRGILQSSVEAT